MHSARYANAPSLGESSGLCAAHRAHRELNLCSDSRVLTGAMDQAGCKRTKVVEHHWFKNTLCKNAQNPTDGLKSISRCLPFFPFVQTLHSSTNQGVHCCSSEWGQAIPDINYSEKDTLQQISKTVTKATGYSFSLYFVLVFKLFYFSGALDLAGKQNVIYSLLLVWI